MVEGSNTVRHKENDEVYHSKWGRGVVISVVPHVDREDEVDVVWDSVGGTYRHLMSYVEPAEDE